MRIYDPDLLIDIVCDVYEKLHNVTVNHSGTFLCEEEINFPERDGDDKFLSFSDDADDCGYSFV